MQAFRLTAKNFRCFPDERPLVLDIDRGFTAFIGPNNAGKSSALRLFYELRHVWAHLADDGSLANVLGAGLHGFGSGNLQDQEEVFTNWNDRDLDLSLEVGPPLAGTPYFKRISLTFSRNGGWNGICKVFDGKNRHLNEARPTKIKQNEGIYKFEGGSYDGRRISGLMRSLASGLYVGAFRNAINQGAGDYYDLRVGTGLVALWNQWKAGASRITRDKVESLTETIREMFGYRSLEINANANDQSLIVVVNRRSYMLNELGSGLAQFIIVLANVAIRSPTFLFIDEPELNLHPALQQRFLRQLSAYATEGVLFATHSLGLARVTSSSIYSFRKEADRTEVHRFEGTPHFSELMGELSFASHREIGYDKVLLVEGITDAPVFREFLRMRNADHKVMVLPLGGDQLARGDVDRELEELKRLTTNLFAIVDSERPDADAPASSRRLGFGAACKRASIPVLLTEKRATENYLSERAIKKVFGASQRALGPFESRDDVKPSWRKDENWRIAAAMTWEELAQTDIGRFLVQELG